MKEIFGKNYFIGYSCYISHGLSSDTLTIEILLELHEIWTLLHRAVCSHFAYTEQSTNTGSCVLARVDNKRRVFYGAIISVTSQRRSRLSRPFMPVNLL